MCKCFQYCLETCYWHLIEKRFCYDESIALYKDSEKDEKNNNCFDNLAFYDSVSVIAGRAIVTIEPLPEGRPIVQQPTRKLRFENDEPKLVKPQSIPRIFEELDDKEQPHKELESSQEISTQVKLDTLKPENLDTEVVEVRRKSLKDRRMSKSLYLKIEQPKEIPIIRQQSMPKFFLDTPDDQSTTSIFRAPSTTLMSPVPKSSGFTYDLYSVVQMERQRVQNLDHRVATVHRKDSERASRLLHIRDKIKLRRVKSSLGGPIMNLPHTHQHI